MTVSLTTARGERPRSGTRQPRHCFVCRMRVGSSRLMHNLHEQPAVTFFWLLTNTPERSSRASIPAPTGFTVMLFAMSQWAQHHPQAGDPTLNQTLAPLLLSVKKLMESRNLKCGKTQCKPSVLAGVMQTQG